MTTIQAIVLGIIEGLTEFLPISSTGHMIIGTAILGIQPDDFVKMFTVNIQFGAILSVVVLYWKKFFQSLDFYYKLIVAFIPAAIFGVLLDKYIDELLGSVEAVALALLLGGIVLLFIDKYFVANEKETEKILLLRTNVALICCDRPERSGRIRIKLTSDCSLELGNMSSILPEPAKLLES